MIYFIIFLALLIYLITTSAMINWLASIIKPEGERTIKDCILLIFSFIVSFPYRIIIVIITEFGKFIAAISLCIEEMVGYWHK